MDLATIFIISIVIFFIYFNFKNSFLNNIHVRSEIDNRRYLVRNVLDKQEAADTLAKINQKLIKLVDHLDKNNKDNVDIQRLKKF